MLCNMIQWWTAVSDYIASSKCIIKFMIWDMIEKIYNQLGFRDTFEIFYQSVYIKSRILINQLHS